MHDDELSDALRRVEPPKGFADRVVQLASTKPPQAAKSGRSQPSRFTAPVRWAIAASLVAAIGGGVWYRGEQRRKEQGEEAKRQVLVSLSFAGSKLKSIEMKVNRGEER